MVSPEDDGRLMRVGGFRDPVTTIAQIFCEIHSLDDVVLCKQHPSRFGLHAWFAGGNNGR